ncbi:MAG: hypothetical protein DRP18_04215 [Candidatus Aenigmatarchaeota archaeon]|nr:MAG: hypothetical protein DRP18_04215 [Candidatus Aenigmarchaeota archaeon]
MPVDTRKPEILVILALVALQALWLLAGLFGAIETNIEMPWILIWTAVSFLVLYGLYMGHTWSWWLTFFYSIYAVLNNLGAIFTGADTTTVLRFLLMLLVLALLTKKTVITEYRPNLVYLEGW